jgi:hypothetical protein
MPTYDPTDHPRLLPALAAVPAPELAARADEAETSLGIAGTAFTGQDAIDLTLAVTRQVNLVYRLEQRGDGLGDVVKEAKGDQSIQYAESKDSGLTTQIDPVALDIVNRILGANGALPSPQLPFSRDVPTDFRW